MVMDQFIIIMEEAIDKAEKVDCGLRNFRKGLQAMKEVLEERIDLEPKEKEE